MIEIVAFASSATALAQVSDNLPTNSAVENVSNGAPERSGDSEIGALIDTNDFTCKPEPGHPRPTLLLHGTGGNESDWSVLAPALRREGYCVFTLNYGNSDFSAIGRLPNIYGTDDITLSSKQVAAYVDDILESTGSMQIDIVGHSQGAVVARNFMRFDGGVDPNSPSNNKVHELVTLGGTNHGTTVDGIGNIIRDYPELSMPASRVFSQAALQQIVGSSFMNRLNEAGDTDRGVRYLVIATKFDHVSTPPVNTFLHSGPDATVKNMFVQDANPDSKVTHKGLSKDPDVIGLVKRELNESDM
ncbi:alpha/beta fold hydrolase [Rhodococcus erythropolis]|uniref:esterase/lipase family protein n=1 Tax=Rhodococcus erythropolis TaxID=1833 RepID=UPI002948D78F|nr:alpha/beta fold hydrolase [Rhodococcus erythropolis]MDV6278411.1 alpha/beta fold hydrolase [Rhodococcus erythropolis]